MVRPRKLHGARNVRCVKSHVGKRFGCFVHGRCRSKPFADVYSARRLAERPKTAAGLCAGVKLLFTLARDVLQAGDFSKLIVYRHNNPAIAGNLWAVGLDSFCH